MAFDFQIQKLGPIMRPDPSNQMECEGVLNPGAARGRDGRLYLFPRVVGPDNYSRIARARVDFNSAGDPSEVVRLGIVLEPGPEYEHHRDTGGCEDPRVTYFKPLDVYLMAYTAWGPSGPKLALAVSEDLKVWQRKGRVDFKPDPSPVYSVNFDDYHNKDGVIFPDAVPGPDGRPSLAMLHRPVYQTSHNKAHEIPPGIDDPLPSIWISFAALEDLGGRIRGRLPLQHHTLLADPEAQWESARIGAGTPPVLTPHGWLLMYHGVCIAESSNHVAYQAGVMLLDRSDPRRVLYRTPAPILIPESEEETSGIVSNVVFPTGIDVRNDIGEPNRADVYYGMADTRVGVARLRLPD